MGDSRPISRPIKKRIKLGDMEEKEGWMGTRAGKKGGTRKDWRQPQRAVRQRPGQHSRLRRGSQQLLSLRQQESRRQSQQILALLVQPAGPDNIARNIGRKQLDSSRRN